MTVAFYPGSFDPITNGHLDVALRAAKLFEKLIIGIYATPNKRLLFTTEERVNLAREAVVSLPENAHRIEVMSFTGLTVDFASKVGAQTMVRGMRTGSDFEREFDLAMMNKRLHPELELVCFMTSQEYQFVSSSILKEVGRLGGKIDDLVPVNVAKALKEKIESGDVEEGFEVIGK
ncbi:MAG: pantetheine-phosphate adenylyltransferase [Chloroflexota bacterium]